jgi:hypothetical protein
VDAGVKHIYYTSLAFANPSKAGVMRAHVRTEKYVRELEEQRRVKVTVLREGLYNESWPLYFGYYFGLTEETRKEVIVAGDGPISWTSIADMAFATAKILSAASEEWAGRTVYLSRKEYENFYVNEKRMEKASVEWWSSTYDALKDGECAIDDATLEDILKQAGRSPTPLEDTIEAMLK